MRYYLDSDWAGRSLRHELSQERDITVSLPTDNKRALVVWSTRLRMVWVELESVEKLLPAHRSISGCTFPINQSRVTFW
jgi:hypothetical protein